MTTHSFSDPESWVDTYADHLYRYALFRLRDPEAALDVVQETFLAAIRSHSTFSGKSSERTWLTGILKHKIVDHIRKAVREKPVDDLEGARSHSEDLFDEKGVWKTKPSEWGGDPEKDLENKELKEALERCLAELPPRLNSAFSLREIDGLNSKEVCKVLNITSTNLWVMLYRARMSLRQCLEKNWFAR